jgi:ribokinase
VVNETELALLTHSDRIANLQIQTRQCRTHPDQIVVVTRGAAGVIALIGNDFFELPGRSVKAVDTTGAGDCFVGALAARLDQGHDIRDALDYANTAASICVQRPGAGPSMPTHSEVLGVRGQE